MEKRRIHKKMIHSADAMHRFAVDFAHDVSGGMVVCLRGDLGTGKTTFAQALLGALGAEGPFVSPTFLVVRQYDLGKDAAGFRQGIERIYHIDAYRITSQDMLELGWEEIVQDASALVIVEWPEQISDIFSQSLDVHTLCFEYADQDVRIVKY
jgi:tRNA threonylcarbamoyladenosine biosynthesis protein TsaE